MNKVIILITFLFLSPSILAHDLPNTFEAGDPIVASEVNENFENINSKLNTLEQTIAEQNFNSGTSTKLSVVGLSEPKRWGTLSYTEGVSVCHNSYPDSQICTMPDLRKMREFPLLSPAIPIALVRQTQSNTGDANYPCYNFKSFIDSFALRIFITASGEFKVNHYTGGNTQTHEYPSNVLSWILSKTEVNSKSELNELNNNEKYWRSGDYLFLNECNTTLPALCCG